LACTAVPFFLQSPFILSNFAGSSCIGFILSEEESHCSAFQNMYKKGTESAAACPSVNGTGWQMETQCCAGAFPAGFYPADTV
jgi:hypothetical protein